MSTKAVIFDADEMIIKRKEYFSSLLSREHNIPPEKILPFFRGEFQDCIVGKADLKEVIAPYLKEWEWEGTVDDLLDYWFKSEQDLDERVIEEIKKLQKNGIKCYLATKNEKYRTEYLKNNLGFGDIFDGIYSGAYVGFTKPDKAFYEFMFNDLNSREPIRPEEIMFWDNEEGNVAPARELGWQGFVYKGYRDFQKIVSRLY